MFTDFNGQISDPHFRLSFKEKGSKHAENCVSKLKGSPFTNRLAPCLVRFKRTTIVNNLKLDMNHNNVSLTDIKTPVEKQGLKTKNG